MTFKSNQFENLEMLPTILRRIGPRPHCINEHAIYTLVHTYVIDNYSFSQGYDLISYTTYVACVNFILEKRNLQVQGRLWTIDFLRNFLIAILFTLRFLSDFFQGFKANIISQHTTY